MVINMTAGETLMSLKQTARAAEAAVEARSDRGWQWKLIALLFGFTVVTPAGFAGTLFGALGTIAVLNGEESTIGIDNALMGIVVVLGSIGIMFLGWRMLTINSFIDSRDKVLHGLQETEDAAYATYFNALKAELSTYGVDPNSMDERTGYKGNNYDFTAKRNGDPIDVNVREYGNEIVFMLNGERMQKPVTV